MANLSNTLLSRMSRSAIACCQLAIASCSDTGGDSTLPSRPAATTAGAASAAPAVTRAAQSLRASITVPQVAPGEEGTECVQVRLDNDAPLHAIKLHNHLSSASHHLIITALGEDASEAPLAPCRPFRGALEGAPLAITQKHEDMVELPEGIGYGLHPHQVLHLELHYLNSSEETVDVTGETELSAVEPDAGLTEASVLLVGTTDIAIPAHSEHQSPLKYLALPQGMQDVKFYAITGHTHRLGTSVRVSAASDEGSPGEELYAPKPYDWEAPEMKRLDPHVTIPQSGGFTLQCGWNNTTDTTVGFGESALAEMCFFWGYYYPRKPIASIVLDDFDPRVLDRL